MSAPMPLRVEVKSIPAIEVRHNPTLPIWIFGWDPKEIRAQCNIERMEWDDATKAFVGYQRDITESHVASILEYLNGGAGVLMPNSIVLAVRSSVGGHRVTFESTMAETDVIRSGILKMPFQFEAGRGVQDSPTSLAWVVDGQHRLAAIERFSYTPGTFPLVFSAVRTEDPKLQLELFVRINSALPITRKLLDRLFSIITTRIGRAKEMRQLASKVRERVLRDDLSPFNDLVKRS